MKTFFKYDLSVIYLKNLRNFTENVFNLLNYMLSKVFIDTTFVNVHLEKDDNIETKTFFINNIYVPQETAK